MCGLVTHDDGDDVVWRLAVLPHRRRVARLLKPGHVVVVVDHVDRHRRRAVQLCTRLRLRGEYLYKRPSNTDRSNSDTCRPISLCLTGGCIVRTRHVTSDSSLREFREVV